MKFTVCNPFGGLGLTGGLVDIEGLYECLAGIYEGKADDSILDKYSEIRRQKYLTIVDPISRDNVQRLFTQDPETVFETDPFIKLLKSLENDPKAHLEFVRSPNDLMYDFTQHYKTHQKSNGTEESASAKSGSVTSHVAQVAPVGAE